MGPPQVKILVIHSVSQNKLKIKAHSMTLSSIIVLVIINLLHLLDKIGPKTTGVHLEKIKKSALENPYICVSSHLKRT